MRKSVLLLALLLATGLSGCVYKGSLYASRPKDKALDHAIDRMWTEEIMKVARDGDWILSRSLTPEGDIIATMVGGEQFSHVSQVDVTHGTIIEATTPVVREISIEELMSRNWYVVLVRPNGVSAEREKESLDIARTQIGKEFDLFGFIGYPEEDKWYCSELAYWSTGMEDLHGKMPTVLMPRAMLNYSTVLYYSGRRNDPQVQAIAAARMNVHHDTAIANASDDAGEVEVQHDR